MVVGASIDEELGLIYHYLFWMVPDDSRGLEGLGEITY
jgi:hypothetical protein